MSFYFLYVCLLIKTETNKKCRCLDCTLVYTINVYYSIIGNPLFVFSKPRSLVLLLSIFKISITACVLHFSQARYYTYHKHFRCLRNIKTPPNISCVSNIHVRKSFVTILFLNLIFYIRITTIVTFKVKYPCVYTILIKHIHCSLCFTLVQCSRHTTFVCTFS